MSWPGFPKKSTLDKINTPVPSPAAGQPTHNADMTIPKHTPFDPKGGNDVNLVLMVTELAPKRQREIDRRREQILNELSALNIEYTGLTRLLEAVGAWPDAPPKTYADTSFDPDGRY